MKFPRLAVFSILSSSIVLAADPASQPASQPTSQPAAKPRVTAGEKTTFFKEPLRKDGTVDYFAAINAIYSKDIKPSDNLAAAILGISGTGRNVLSDDMREKFLATLEVKESKGIWIEYKPMGETEVEKSKEWDTMYGLRKKIWTEKDNPHVAAWLKENAAAIDAVVDASKRNHYFIPCMQRNSDTSLAASLTPNLGHTRQYADTLLCRAMLRLGEGDVKGFQSDVIATARIGRVMSQGGALIEKLVGFAIDSVAANAVSTAATSGKLTAAEAAALAKEIDALPPLMPIADAIDMYERCAALDIIAQISTRGVDAITSLTGQEPDDAVMTQLALAGDELLDKIDFDAILVRFNKLYNEIVAAMREKDYEQRALMLEEVESKIEAYKNNGDQMKDRKVSAYIGDMLIPILLPAITQARGIEDKARTFDDLARVSLALAAYRADNNAYPEKLADIAGKYIAKLPGDLFTDKPFIYKRTEKGYTLYSIGPDLKDNGGTPYNGRKGDYVITAEK